MERELKKAMLFIYLVSCMLFDVGFVYMHEEIHVFNYQDFGYCQNTSINMFGKFMTSYAVGSNCKFIAEDWRIMKELNIMNDMFAYHLIWVILSIQLLGVVIILAIPTNKKEKEGESVYGHY